MFVQHNIFSGVGLRSESSYLDLWLVDSIFCRRKVNLGYIIIWYMKSVITSTHSILPFGILLNTIFQYFGVNLDDETDM